MSYSIDVNILLYASDESSPNHSRAREFLVDCATRPEVLCLSWVTMMAYLRISTHPTIFRAPLSADAARRNIGELLSLPHVRPICESDGFWELYSSLMSGESIRGNLVPDSHLAVLLKQHEVGTLYTNDSDFRRFEFLNVRNPFSES